MNKRQRKKSIRKLLRHELTKAGWRVVEDFGPSPLRALVGDMVFHERLKEAYLEVLTRYIVKPPKPKRMLTLNFTMDADGGNVRAVRP